MDTNYAPTIHGIPDDHAAPSPLWWQGDTNECAIYAQWNILRDYGIDIDEKTLVEQAKALGWFTDEDGTPPEALGNLLEYNGVDCDRYVDANRYNLLHELAQGKRVIVTVDANELWRENTVLTKLWEGVKDIFAPGANHALVVSGIDTSDPDNIQVVLTDSGTGHRTISYPIEQFEDAWKDGGCTMIVTQNPPPQSIHLPSMVNFDYAADHIPTLGNVDFNIWLSKHTDDLDDCTICPIEVPQSDGGDAESSDVAAAYPKFAEQGNTAISPWLNDALSHPMRIAEIVDAKDTDGDGVTDRLEIDGDGIADTVIDTENIATGNIVEMEALSDTYHTIHGDSVASQEQPQ